MLVVVEVILAVWLTPFPPPLDVNVVECREDGDPDDGEPPRITPPLPLLLAVEGTEATLFAAVVTVVDVAVVDEVEVFD